MNYTSSAMVLKMMFDCSKDRLKGKEWGIATDLFGANRQSKCKIYDSAPLTKSKTRRLMRIIGKDLSLETKTRVTFGFYKDAYDYHTYSHILKKVFTMKMEILLEPTSNKLMVEHAEYDESNTYVLERFNTTAGNPVKKILLKLNLSDHRLCKMVVECRSVKVKEFQERCNIKAFQEWYEHVGPEVASPQDGKVSRWQRDCAWLMISRCSRSQCQIQVQGTSSIQEVNDHYNIFTRESQECELKTKDKA
ncbi:hypothetical protein Tco_0594124 [Tanacetum coccineum]